MFNFGTGFGFLKVNCIEKQLGIWQIKQSAIEMGQSSAGCAGLLTFIEATGVIMGANIGTTLTAWMVFIFGFKFSITPIAVSNGTKVTITLDCTKRVKIQDNYLRK